MYDYFLNLYHSFKYEEEKPDTSHQITIKFDVVNIVSSFMFCFMRSLMLCGLYINLTKNLITSK